MDSLDENQEKIEKLISWKRHEQPPPGYFSTFSARVIAQIESEELAANKSWWHWLAGTFAKPAVACAYGMALGAVLVAGISLTQDLQDSRAQAPDKATAIAGQYQWHAEPAATVPAAPSVAERTGLAKSLVSSVDPAIDSGPPSFLFNGSGVKAQFANFTLR